MTSDLQQSDFARAAAQVAQLAAEWAADILTLPERATSPVDQESVRRFVDDISRMVGRVADRADVGSDDAGYSALAAENAKLREGLSRAAAQFEFYRNEHLLKGTDDGRRKAETNAEMAEMCRSLLRSPKPTDPVRPDHQMTRAQRAWLLCLRDGHGASRRRGSRGGACMRRGWTEWAYRRGNVTIGRAAIEKTYRRPGDAHVLEAYKRWTRDGWENVGEMLTDDGRRALAAALGVTDEIT